MPRNQSRARTRKISSPASSTCCWLSALALLVVVAHNDQSGVLVTGFAVRFVEPLCSRQGRGAHSSRVLLSASSSNPGSTPERNQERQKSNPQEDIPSPTTSYDDGSSSNNTKHPEDTLYNKFFRFFVQRLAEMSLEDYQWRTNIFKSTQADRMLEESLARMRGANATYVRPMDATSLGPLGRWEKQSVDWLFQVIDEEGRRARRIVENAGKLVRPSDNKKEDGGDDEESLGPLGFLEKQVVEFWTKIRQAEQERVRTKTLRPKDLDERFRGPLGQLELEAVRAWDELRDSERLRAQQSRLRGGEIVRPIDVPGPLGELELKVAELFQAEQRRARERERNAGKLVRPKDAAWKGPLGQAELTAYETIQSLSREEMERLRNIRLALQERRPMEIDRDSPLGAAEALFVGILRAPQMLVSVVKRVGELLQSQELLDDGDKELMRKRQKAVADEIDTNASKRKDDDDDDEDG